MSWSKSFGPGTHAEVEKEIHEHEDHESNTLEHHELHGRAKLALLHELNEEKFHPESTGHVSASYHGHGHSGDSNFTVQVTRHEKPKE